MGEDEAWFMALAEALYNYEPRNQNKPFAHASQETRYRYADKAAWITSQATKALIQIKPQEGDS